MVSSGTLDGAGYSSTTRSTSGVFDSVYRLVVASVVGEGFPFAQSFLITVVPDTVVLGLAVRGQAAGLR
jgi:hypothetical protein